MAGIKGCEVGLENMSILLYNLNRDLSLRGALNGTDLIVTV